VLCSELPNNEGSSVTYSAHQIAAEVIRYNEFALPPMWIEHYLGAGRTTRLRRPPARQVRLDGVFMSAYKEGWMRHRGQSWSDGLEMAVAMIAGMVVLMIYRWNRYAHGSYSHRARTHES
jgi:hypothetical protein